MSELGDYKSQGTNIACEDDYEKPEFAGDFEPIPVVSESYYPTRLEYFAGKALQGLVVGRADKDLNNVSKTARTAVALSKALEIEIDSAKD